MNDQERQLEQLKALAQYAVERATPGDVVALPAPGGYRGKPMPAEEEFKWTIEWPKGEVSEEEAAKMVRRRWLFTTASAAPSRHECCPAWRRLQEARLADQKPLSNERCPYCGKDH